MKDYSPTIFGIIIIIANIIGFYTLGVTNNDDGKQMFAVIQVIGRIIIAIMLYSIAEKQNRSSLGWAILGLFLPALALIIIGLFKRKKGQFDEVTTISIEQQIELLEGKDDDYELIIQNIRNQETHRTTVKEWKQFIEVGTSRNFRLVRW